MSKHRKRQDLLRDVSSNPEPQTKFLDPQVSRMQPIIFGFKLLDLNRKPFDCSHKHVDGLLDTLKMLILFSGVQRNGLEISYRNCHPVPADQVKKHKLEKLVTSAPSNRLHQLGKSRTPERIVGFFDSPLNNLFQVCFFDLNHSLSG